MSSLLENGFSVKGKSMVSLCDWFGGFFPFFFFSFFPQSHFQELHSFYLIFLTLDSVPFKSACKIKWLGKKKKK